MGSSPGSVRIYPIEVISKNTINSNVGILGISSLDSPLSLRDKTKAKESSVLLLIKLITLTTGEPNLTPNMGT